MKYALIIMVLAQTACVSTMMPIAHPQMMPNGSFNDSRYDIVRREQQENGRQWAEWDRKHIPDDQAVIEIYDKNGNLISTALAK
jgi:hypothetical protein